MNILTWIQKGVTMFTQSRLKSGIVFDMQTNFTDLKFATDPYRYFALFGFRNILTQFAQSETTMFSEAKHNLLRETLVNRPAIGPASLRSSVETQIITNNVTGNTTQDSTRERDRLIIVLSPIIWIASHIYAFDPEARRIFTMQAMNQTHIPTLTVELFKRTRNCENGFFRWTTAIVLTSWTTLVAATPELVNTFYDPNFLRTQGGTEMFLSLCNYLGLRGQANYIAMSQPTRENLPPLESGYTVTANAYSVGQTHLFTRTTVYITSHSLNEPSFVYAADSIVGTYHYLNLNDREYVGQQVSSFRTICNATSLQWVEHILLRVTGEQPNSWVKNDKSTELKDTAADVKPKTGRRRNSPSEVIIDPKSIVKAITKQLRTTIRKEIYSFVKTQMSNNNKQKQFTTVPVYSGFNQLE